MSSTELAVVGGVDSPDPHDAVIALLQPHGRCSATLVAPNLVLTARHCVSASSSRSASPDGVARDGPSSDGVEVADAVGTPGFFE